MNKSILFTIILFISIALLMDFAKAAEDDLCKCKARAVVKCGFGKSSEACKCRSEYSQKCNTKCSLVLKCSNQISEKCLSFKKGSLEYKKCERSVSTKNCVSLLTKSELYNCKCKTFAKAICGSCPSPTGVNCRDDAFEACKKQCGAKARTHDKKRICITPPNCSCKTLAKNKCTVATDPKSCFVSEFDSCKKRCIAATRCYPVSCKNAGLKRCANAVSLACDNVSSDLKKYEECVVKKTQRCQAYELATCKKARRLFKYRAECDYTAQKKCSGFTGEQKCACESQIRAKCVQEKVELRKKYIRHSSTCSKRAQLLCDAKEHCKDLRQCYIEETKHCIRRKHRREYITPPECVERVFDFCGSKEGDCYKENIGKCTEIWLRRVCERKAFKDCDGELTCMKSEVQKCKSRLPKCWNNRELCNDNNKCTNDVCDAKVGCLHIPKSCNDNNLCTTDSCDAKLGCKNTLISCDDGVTCTVDKCDTANGKCEHTFDNTLCATNDKCTVGYCTSTGCQFHKEAKCDTPRSPPSCDTCKPANACLVAKCEIQENLTIKCTSTPRDCNDGKKCTADSCDVATGKCVHTKIVSAECSPSSPLCQDNLDCVAWGTSQDLTCKCSVAVCDATLGICTAAPSVSKTCVTCEQCKQSCAPRDACDGITTSCTKDNNGKIVCNRPTVSCDDASICTTDSCNINTGVCEHKFVKSQACLQQCEIDNDCIQWAIESQLDKQCQTAKCDKTKKSCVIIDQLDQSKCKQPHPICLECTPKNACETAECFYDEDNTPACRRTTIHCDDANPCTTDSCDTKTGKCVHTFVENAVCKKCANHIDCDAWAKSLNLDRACMKGVCDANTGLCLAKPNGKTCIAPECQNCGPLHKCEVVSCAFDRQGKPFCARRSLVCNDNDACTTDSCNEITGCVFTPVNTDNCLKCKADTDCAAWGVSHKLSDVCREAYCNTKGHCRSRAAQNQSKCKAQLKCADCAALTKCDQATCKIGANGIPVCTHTQVKCDDGDSCTEDYCDINTGNCVHNKIYTKECSHCQTDKDCSAWALTQNLADTCQESFCHNNYCRVRIAKDATKCQAPICVDCVSTLCAPSQCIFGDDNKPVCVTTQKSCDDGNKCTVDKCDLSSGNCVHTFFQTSQCQPCGTTQDCTQWGVSQNLDSTCQVPLCNTQFGYCDSKAAADTSKCTVTKCAVDADCNDYAVKNKLADQCLQAFCDTDAAKCSSKAINDLTKCTPLVCKGCTASSPCETAQCQQTPTGYICNRTPKDCNDNNDCTTDSCDSTGNCVHTTVYTDKKCVQCSADTDCATYAIAQNLNNCQQAKCDTTLKLCTTQAVADKTCVPSTFCQQQCPPKDKCSQSVCHYDANQKVVCDSQIPVNCNDNNVCTVDTCEPTKGCVHHYQSSATCQKCTKDSDCANYALSSNLNAQCQVGKCDASGQCVSAPSPNPSCVPQDICTTTCSVADKCQSYGCQYDANKKVQCTYVTNTCNDGKDCTTDSCDSKTGLCVHVQSSKCGPACKTTVDCTTWGTTQNLAANCKQPYCDLQQGECVAVDVPDITKCPVPNCAQACPSTKCQTFTCSYDKNKQVVCAPQDISCNDNDACTTDTCDINSGCVHTFVPSKTCHQCTKDADCSAWATKLGNCFTVSCDTTSKKCVKTPVISATCAHTTVKCPDCKAANLCQTATLVKDADSCTCKITPTNCDDGVTCTVDSCDATTGKCLNVFKASYPQCTVQCQVDAQCGKYAVDNKLYQNCQIAVCDKTLGSCAAKVDDKTNCIKCNQDCKPNNNCDYASCVWIGTKYQCQHSPKNCDDGKTCTTDSCNAKTGQCEHVFDKCPGSTPQCNTDIDCTSWGLANKLSSQCLKPVCNQNQGACQSVPDTSCTSPCSQTSDCPPSQFGSVCVSGTCVPNKCQYDADCLTSNTSPGVWNYCKPCPTGANCCVPVPKCSQDVDCNDNNPCTSDVCLPEYGFCRNIPQCNDNNACTNDICTPSADAKSFTCSNPPISCTIDSSLLNQNFVLLSNDDKAKWLGKCDKNKGCVSCVVNAQCDDHNGCSTDSCQQQYCISVPINNAWCDPKLASQPITYQSIPGLRTALELAGYDIDKLAT